MSDLYWLTDEQMARLQPYFPKSHGRERVDDRRVLSGIIFVNRNGLRWRDAPTEYGPPKTLYNRWKRWSDKGIFIRMMEGLACQTAFKRDPRSASKKDPLADMRGVCRGGLPWKNWSNSRESPLWRENWRKLWDVNVLRRNKLSRSCVKPMCWSDEARLPSRLADRSGYRSRRFIGGARNMAA